MINGFMYYIDFKYRVFTLVTLFSLNCLFPEIEFKKKDEIFNELTHVKFLIKKGHERKSVKDNAF